MLFQWARVVGPLGSALWDLTEYMVHDFMYEGPY